MPVGNSDGQTKPYYSLALANQTMILCIFDVSHLTTGQADGHRSRRWRLATHLGPPLIACRMDEGRSHKAGCSVAISNVSCVFAYFLYKLQSRSINCDLKSVSQTQSFSHNVERATWHWLFLTLHINNETEVTELNYWQVAVNVCH